MKLPDVNTCIHCLLLILTIISLTDSRPSRKRHTNRHRERNSKHKIKNKEQKMGSRASKQLKKELELLTMHNMISPYVRFSDTKPKHSPWETAPDISTNSLSNNNSTDDADRLRRSAPDIEVNACKTLSVWTELPTAEDMNGNTVQVMSTITVGSIRQTQYIYETFCFNESEPPCLGIDSSQYTSRCKTKYTYVYAYVRTITNDVGLNRIKVRGSCVCSVKKKPDIATSSIWDDLLRKR